MKRLVLLAFISLWWISSFAANFSYEVYGQTCDEKYLFGIGGSRKTLDQIADIPDSYLAVDNIETCTGNRIPLWMFGLLY